MIIPVKTAAGGYDIILERGAHRRADRYLRLDRKALVVTDDGVPPEYAKTVAKACKAPFIVTLPQGEKTKSLDSYKLLLSEMVKNDFTRSDCVVAVGGGVVGDLAGFVAASYMRGVDFYNIPTTVLSQVDSSIGGKVAVDFYGYKNIVGAFYPPKAVIIDPDMLKTLPDRQISNGLAEAVKMSLTSLKIKRYVVEKDEKEGGLRKILNFGHTLAHAIESENAMEKLYHGECVALGMIPMCSDTVRPRLISVLEKLNLPTKTETDAEAVINAMKHDKKMSGDKITVIFVPEVGSYEMRKMPFSEFEKQIRSAL